MLADMAARGNAIAPDLTSGPKLNARLTVIRLQTCVGHT